MIGSRHGRTLDILQLAVAIETGSTLFLYLDKILPEVAKLVDVRIDA